MTVGTNRYSDTELKDQVISVIFFSVSLGLCVSVSLGGSSFFSVIKATDFYG
jgi:hypothetical protein